jgi:hypothetical protein
MTVASKSLIILVSTSFLAACGGGGSTGGGPSPVTPRPTGNPSIHDPLTDGPTMGDTLRMGASKSAGARNGTRLVYSAATDATTSLTPGMSLQKNVLGGYNLTMNGKTTTFGYADQKQAPDAWEKIVRNPQGQPVYSLTLWNAGKGARGGVETAESGQTFHKIMGYYLFDYSGTAGGTRERGHFIVGNETDPLRMATKTRTATYDGYFYANVMPLTGAPPDQALAASGGMKFNADFDADTISGQSTTFNVREAGAPNFNPQTYTVTMQPTAITGNSFSGTMTSNYLWMNGTYSGQFYGGNAQEIGGVMTGTSGAAINEGFFTAVAPRSVTP